jgi:mRNA interferase MazF
MRKFEILLANLDPRFGTEPGKTRPVVVVQTDLLNEVHPSVIVCPITTNITEEAKVLRVYLDTPENGLDRPSDILVDQIRAIDKRRIVKKLGQLDQDQRTRLLSNLRTLLLE